ncbi:hypothetical protein EHM69_12720 [candidate division KSB1 bacterium]|nr:MAG: hypothetical protein EHM69_12720 [candidate division KSB1 bacterium]
MKSTVVVFIIAFLYHGAAFAQPSTPDLLAVDSAFVNNEYERVELLTLRILQSGVKLTEDESARLNLTAGYALIMLGRESDARSYFSRALDAVPNLTLDPVQVSPKFRVVFDDVKAARPKPGTEPKPDTTAVLQGLTKQDRQAWLSNLILPGSGQWKMGKRTRGAIIFGAQIGTLGWMIKEIIEMQDSRAEYMAETDPVKMRDKYNDYNRNYQNAWIAGISAGVIYIAAQADLVRLETKSGQEFGWRVAPLQSGASVGLCVKW